MADEPDNIVPVHTPHFEPIEMRLTDIEKQLDDDNKIVRYSSGLSPAAQLRQAQRQSRIDAGFGRLEKPLSDKMPM